MRDQFTGRPSVSQPGTHTSYFCNGCSRKIFDWQHWNASRALAHVRQCRGIPDDIARRCIEASQSFKKARREEHLTVKTPGRTLGSETAAEVRSAILAESSSSSSSSSIRSIRRAASSSTVARQPSILSLGWAGPASSPASATVYLRSLMEASLVRGEPPSRLLDPFVQSSLITCIPGIGKHLPQSPDAIFDIVYAIDDDTTKEMQNLMARVPGQMGVSCDGVTVLGSSNLFVPPGRLIRSGLPSL